MFGLVIVTAGTMSMSLPLMAVVVDVDVVITCLHHNIIKAEREICAKKQTCLALVVIFAAAGASAGALSGGLILTVAHWPADMIFLCDSCVCLQAWKSPQAEPHH